MCLTLRWMEHLLINQSIDDSVAMSHDAMQQLVITNNCNEWLVYLSASWILALEHNMSVYIRHKAKTTKPCICKLHYQDTIECFQEFSFMSTLLQVSTDRSGGPNIRWLTFD